MLFSVVVFLLLLLPLTAQVTVTAQLTDGTGSVASTWLLHFELEL
jgi:hypothetical protein